MLIKLKIHKLILRLLYKFLKKHGYNSFGVIKCCKKEKKYKTAYGFKWEYCE